MFEDILYRIGPETIFLVIIFLISFILINISLRRVLNKQQAAAGIISFLVSIGVTYGIWLNGFDIQGFIYDLGITSETLYLLIPILLLAKVIAIIWLFGFSALFLILGGLLITLSFWAYESEIVLGIGIGLLLIGVIIKWVKREKTLILHNKT